MNSLLVSSWYKPQEIAPRVAVLYCGNTIANGFGGILAAGILSGLNGSAGLAGWRWLFIIEGAVTVVVALICVFILPNFPRTTAWLSEEEKDLAIWRLEEDIGEDDWVDSEEQSFLAGAKLAFSDTKTWILVSYF